MEGLNINNMDFMSFINSMNKMNKSDKKKKKAKKGVIKECKISDDSENVAVNKDISDCCEIKEETDEDTDNSCEDSENKKLKKCCKEDDDDEDDDDEDDDDEDEEDEDDDDDDEDDDDEDEDEDEDDDEDDDDDDDDEDIKDLDILTSEKLYNMLNTFFVDEYGVTIATSMSNISYELHNLNKNLSKLLKSKK